MKEVVIAAAARTPIGSYGGSLKSLTAVDLGVVAVKGAIERAGIDPATIDEVLFGNVLQGGLGQNVARQVAMNAGIPKEVPAMTINKVCGSGLRTISMAASMIKAGDADIIVAGGAESMSQAGYVSPNTRWGARMGDVKLVDMMIKDGLTDAFNNIHMGITAENVAEQWNLTREQLDEFAASSQQKAEKARAEGKFKDEIVPVEIPQRKGDPIIFEEDEYIKPGTTAEGIAKLRPAFKKDGMVTAANASGLNDSGAAVIVMSKEKADELGIKPLCKVAGYASAGVDPTIMGIGPIPASEKAMKNAGITVKDLDLVEANEAFAAQAIVVGDELGYSSDIVNVNGGAIALGHPIGASGCRIFITMIFEMMKRDSKYGLSTLCIGGGQGVALIAEM